MVLENIIIIIITIATIVLVLISSIFGAILLLRYKGKLKISIFFLLIGIIILGLLKVGCLVTFTGNAIGINLEDVCKNNIANITYLGISFFTLLAFISLWAIIRDIDHNHYRKR